MATAPNYATTPILALAQITTSVTTRGTAPNVTIYTSAAANGVRLQELSAKLLGTATAGTIVLYLSDGTVHRALASEFPVASTAATATAATIETVWNWGNPGLWLPNGYSLRANYIAASAASLTNNVDLVLQGAIA